MTEVPPKKIQCPTCQKKSYWDTNNPYRPFCSERCRLIDLGEWLSESPNKVMTKD